MSDSYKIYASKDYVDNKALPNVSEPNMQLVTDTYGNKVWEEQTHYKRDRIMVKLSPKIDKPANGERGGLYVGGAQSNDPIQADAAKAIATEMSKLSAYSIWVIYWDGVRYECTMHRLPLVWNIGQSTWGVPFGADIDVTNGASIYYNDDNEHTLEWELAEPDLKQLDEDFISSTVPVIQSAQVGQTIVVKAVDENGKPTEWEAVDAVTETRVKELIAEALAV